VSELGILKDRKGLELQISKQLRDETQRDHKEHAIGACQKCSEDKDETKTQNTAIEGMEGPECRWGE
jgi:hypothetical protein